MDPRHPPGAAGKPAGGVGRAKPAVWLRVAVAPTVFTCAKDTITRGPGGREHGGECRLALSLVAIAKAEHSAPRGRVPERLVGKIELKGGERSIVVGQCLQPVVVGEAGLLEFLALRDIEVESAHAFQRAFGADKQARQVVAGSGFARPAGSADHPRIGGDHGQRQRPNLRVQQVFHHAHPSWFCCRSGECAPTLCSAARCDRHERSIDGTRAASTCRSFVVPYCPRFVLERARGSTAGSEFILERATPPTPGWWAPRTGCAGLRPGSGSAERPSSSNKEQIKSVV